MPNADLSAAETESAHTQSAPQIGFSSFRRCFVRSSGERFLNRPPKSEQFIAVFQSGERRHALPLIRRQGDGRLVELPPGVGPARRRKVRSGSERPTGIPHPAPLSLLPKLDLLRWAPVWFSPACKIHLRCPSSCSLLCSLDVPNSFFFNRRSCSMSQSTFSSVHHSHPLAPCFLPTEILLFPCRLFRNFPLS